ncbi:hypothetical protein RF11_03479 [Thelohanellus kitauei]|uniref:Uncharacterized protein n=1 Tax=Thelohanellus kitauei TaxID=669202 RepID=A0A0C2ME73_THEKT|nr:hypothetical protein RF11_03479 [Thelohanellus kitauei]
MPMLEAMDEGKEFKFTLVDDMHGARRAWEKVGMSTTSNCFAKTKFIEGEIQTEAQDAELVDILESLPADEKIKENREIEPSNFIEANELLATVESFTSEEIAEAMMCSEGPVESEDEDITFEEEVISFEEAQ